MAAPEPVCLQYLQQAQRWIDQGLTVSDHAEARSLALAAAEAGCQEVIQLLMRAGFDLEKPGWNGGTLLMEAVQFHKQQAVKTLLACGANVHARHIHGGMDLLKLAAQTSTPAIAAILLEHGAPVPSGSGKAPEALFDAAQKNKPEIIRQIVQAGADANALDSYGRSALHHAASYGSLAAAQTLAQLGASLDLPDSHGKTPLMAAVEFGNESMTQFLLDRGANPLAQMNSGATALHLLGSTSKSAARFASRALAAGLDPNHAGPAGATPLAAAAMAGDLETVQLLLQAGAEVNRAGPRGDSALIHAVRREHVQVVKTLLEHGADANAASDPDGSALFIAVQQSEAGELVPLLLAHGANPAQSIQGKSPQAAAVALGKTQIVQILLESAGPGASSEPTRERSELMQMAGLIQAIYQGDRDGVERLLRHPFSITAQQLCQAASQGHRSHRILELAIQHDFHMIARMMLEGGFDPFTHFGENNLLAEAARFGRVEMARLLIEHGANPFTETERGQSPVDYANTQEMARVICHYREGKGSRFPPLSLPPSVLNKPLSASVLPPADPPALVPSTRGKAGAGEQPPKVDRRSWPVPLEQIRWIAALLLGLPLAVTVTGAFYSIDGIHGGHYGGVFALALLELGLLWLTIRLGRCDRAPRVILGASLIFCTLGPFWLGHAIGYADLKSYAYRAIQADEEERFPPAWKELDRENAFRQFVGHVTGRAGGGWFGYFRAQAALGWEGREGRRVGALVVERRGWRVWRAWLVHAGCFFAASAGALFLAAKD